MELVGAAVLTGLTSSVVSKLFTAGEKMCQGKDKESKELKLGIDYLRRELPMIHADLTKLSLTVTGQPKPVAISMGEFRDVALDIEDCLDEFLSCAACGKDEIQGSKKEFRGKIAELRTRLEGALGRKKSYNVNNQASCNGNGTNHHEDTGPYGACPAVGIDKPKQELWELLVGGGAGEGSKLKVISIVAFGGSGKTALAWAMYDCDQVKERFPLRAWAMASEHKHHASQAQAQAQHAHDAQILLTSIFKGLQKTESVPQQLSELQQCIKGLLESKRCLIVIDDVKMELWDKITPIFPEKKKESRILVTTALTSVATACSFHGGYIYRMRPLSAEHSKEYLEKKVFDSGYAHAFERGSRAIVDKCAGHPLALVSVAKALQGCEVTSKICEDISKDLCSHMEENKNGNFSKLGQVFTNNYSSLPDDYHKSCLLYASIFPNDRPFSTNTLIRRLSAEGYINGDQQLAYGHLNELIDRNIVQPVDASNNSKVKTCKTHGIMNQFMLHKSRSSNFIANFSDKNRSNCRHLVIQNYRKHASTSAATSGSGKQLRPRSLTIFGGANDDICSDLTNYKLLRVLDLKDCSDNLTEDHLKYIYKLSRLQYLTLGRSINKLSSKMGKLHCLETLDLRNAEIETVPEEVITLLPHLAHLFGKIKLNKVGSNNRKHLNLQTLSGVIVDNKSGFPELMVHMKNLTKVKIWCETTSTDSNYTILSDAIHNFAQAEIDTSEGTRSLSLHVNDSSKGLLDATSRKPSFLGSLKLHGRPSQFPQFVKSMCSLRELCLSYTNLAAGDLSRISVMPELLYLKLVEVHLARLEINLKQFPILERLCLVVQNSSFPTIQQGPLPSPLVSLQLLCKDLTKLISDPIQVDSFGRLREIALDSMVNKETIETWKKKARTHPKRPRVLLLKRVDPVDRRSTVKHVAAEQTTP
ncbi:disease resistance protein RGA4-like [Triticum urartu]|uniref:disease resistance protein RGA4-like n=1 Tax=Triticum urartu TaxID=4572 RepID=UPI002042E598|nr:disease resistance protein RGA4-like [Triticum urartu]